MVENMQPAMQPAKKPHAHGPGRQFTKGVSGNPSGSTRSKRYVELYDKFAVELGELNAIDTALLGQAVTLMCRAERAGTPVNDVVRCTNLASRLIDGLRTKRAAATAAAEHSFAHMLHEGQRA